MTWLSIHFVMPWVLLLLPLPLVIGFVLPKWQQQEQALNVPFYQALAAHFCHQANQQQVALWQKWMALFIWILLIVAAANPQRLGKPIPLPNKGRAMLLAIDLSGSMAISDMLDDGQLKSRLQVVKQVATSFIKQRQGDQIGLILFGENAYLRTPITYDLNTVQHMLNAASVGIAGQKTNIGDAIGLAIKHLIKFPQNDRILILMTDGRANAGSVTPTEAAKMAKALHIKIYTIGLDSKTNIPLVTLNVDGPDNALLKHIASMTGGMYFRARNAQDLEAVYKRLNTLVPIATQKQYFSPPHLLYPWPLGLALIISFILALSFYAPAFSQHITRRTQGHS